MIANKLKDNEKLKLLDRFNYLYTRLSLNLNSSYTKDELFEMYSNFIKNNSNLNDSYIMNIDGFIFQNDDDKTLDENALEYLQNEINKG